MKFLEFINLLKKHAFFLNIFGLIKMALKSLNFVIAISSFDSLSQMCVVFFNHRAISFALEGMILKPITGLIGT